MESGRGRDKRLREGRSEGEGWRGIGRGGDRDGEGERWGREKGRGVREREGERERKGEKGG